MVDNFVMMDDIKSLSGDQCSFGICGCGFEQVQVSENNVGNNSVLSIEEYQTLRRLMTKYEASFGIASSAAETPSQSEGFINSSLFAHPGTASSIDQALSCGEKKLNSWVLDSGASSHMTGISTSFRSYFPCSGRDKVRIADGSLASVSGVENGENTWMW